MTFEEDYCRNCKAERKKQVKWLQAFLDKKLVQKNIVNIKNIDMAFRHRKTIKQIKKKITEAFEDVK